MGSALSVRERAAASQPSDEFETFRRRQDYLNRLGIGVARLAPAPSPTKAVPPLNRHAELLGVTSELTPLVNICEAPATGAEVDENIADATASAGIEKRVSAQENSFRVNFLRKLSYEKVWVPSAQRRPKYQTVTIFDWDDTLLCTTYLHLLEDETVPAVIDCLLRQTARWVQRLLETALRVGQAFIITNASSNWVEFTTAKWMPELLPVLQNVKVISARSRYEPEYPGDVSQWKVQAFMEVQRQMDDGIIANLIAVGDSENEMNAARVMGKAFAQAVIKTVKFRESPRPEELVKQLELVAQKFERIVQNARDLNVVLEKKEKQHADATQQAIDDIGYGFQECNVESRDADSSDSERVPNVSEPRAPRRSRR